LALASPFKKLRSEYLEYLGEHDSFGTWMLDRLKNSALFILVFGSRHCPSLTSRSPLTFERWGLPFTETGHVNLLEMNT